MSIFLPADILLPDPAQTPSFEKWAAIACDQFTSEPEYWVKVREIAGEAYSTSRMILPEAELSIRDESYIEQIHKNMSAYKQAGIYQSFPDSFTYAERVQHDGTIRKGVIGCIDLDAYDYSPVSSSLIRSTEKTVIERIPPRVAVRKGAPTELSHVILYADDEKDALIGPLTRAAADGALPLLYDFDLMMQGGHIRGYLVSGQDRDAFMERLQTYYHEQDDKAAAMDTSSVYFTVADGNHSLASAKECWRRAKEESLKQSQPVNPRLRYALVELENLHDDAQTFLPIHRLMKGIDPDAFLACAREELEGQQENGTAGYGTFLSIPYYTAGQSGQLKLSTADAGEAIVRIQAFIDRYLEQHKGEVDYIHGDAALLKLAEAKDTVGLLLPAITKDGFFGNIMKSGVYPRKTFSVGEAQDKRYYLEVRDLYEG